MVGTRSVKDIDDEQSKRINDLQWVEAEKVKGQFIKGEYLSALAYYFLKSSAVCANGTILENHKLLDVLLEKGADPNASFSLKDKNDLPIFYAIERAMKGYTKTLKLLLKKDDSGSRIGANPNVVIGDVPLLHFVFISYVEKNKSNELQL